MLAILAVISVSSAAYGQYGESLLVVSRSTQLTVGEALWLLGSASGSIRPGVSVAEARNALGELTIRLPDQTDDQSVSLGQYSFLLVQLFDVQGGFWYGLIPGPLSALRALQAFGLVPADAHVGQRVTGAEAVEILRRYLRLAEEGDAGG